MGISAFCDKKSRPSDEEIISSLGSNLPLWLGLIQHIRETYPTQDEFKFQSGKNYGSGLWVNYEMVEGKVVKAKKVVRKPVEEYLKTQKRFRHLFKPKRQDAEIAAIQAMADRNAEKYAIDIKLKKE